MKKLFCRGLLFFSVLGYTHNFAQHKPLRIGDTIPEKVLTTSLQVVNSPHKTARLIDDKDKLILLDFWATWCSACLLNFPKMEELQKQYGDRIKIIAVTYQNRDLIEKFFSSKNGMRYNKLFSVTDDKMFTELFPHRGIPYIAWIKDGKLVNTTDAEQVTAKSINEILENKESSLQTIVQMSRDRPLFLSEEFDRQKHTSMLNYSFLSKGHIPEIGAGITFRKNEEQKVNGCLFTNLSLWDIYFSIGYQIFNSLHIHEGFTEKRMLVDVNDIGKIIGVQQSDGTFDGQDLYNYELNVPATKSDSLYPYMLEDLNRYTPLKAIIQKKNVQCLILKRTSSKDKIATKGGDLVSTFPQSPSVLQNAPLSHMVNMINGKTPIKLPLIDETGYKENVDLRISGITTAEKLNKELQKYDLEVVEEQRELMMMVITDQ